MCRKWTSSLTAQFLVISERALNPPLAQMSSYAEYQSSPRRFRGFCVQCGSSLIWRSEDDTRTLDLFLGTLDEQWLVEETTTQDRSGFDVAKALATPNGTQFWLRNAIRGVTDLVKGGMEYLTEGPDGLR